jgi:hypothetical protein
MTYCSAECQRKDWSHHKLICKLLNPGKAQQLRHEAHGRKIGEPERIMGYLSSMPENCKKLYELFRATVPNEETRLKQMVKIVKRIPMVHKEWLVFQSMAILQCFSVKSLEQPTSPLLVLLGDGGVDPSFLSHDIDIKTPDETSTTPLHFLTSLTIPDFDKMKRQVCIAKQLIEHGADVNARAGTAWGSHSPLFTTCHSSICTNLDLIKLLLDNGADPNQGRYICCCCCC